MKQFRIRTPIVVLSLILVFGLAGISFAAQKGKGQVVVYNWSEYIPQDVLDDFTKETGIRVVYSTFESNEAMYARVKLQRGKGYDVIVPSTYFVEMMRRDKLLQELDHSKLPNLVNLDPKLMDQEYDPGNKFSIPYMWGSTGMAYNTKHVPEGSLTRWSQLLQPEFKGHIIMTDDLRDAFGLALRAKGHSSNSRDPAQIKEAFDFLVQLKGSVRVFDVTAIRQALITEEVRLGPIWNSDFLESQEENDKLAYVFPEEGALLWVDSFAIPTRAANVDNAHTFINYMLRPEVALRCIKKYKSSSPNLKAIEMLPEELRNNRVLVPGPEELKNAEFTTSVGEALSIYEKFWEELKAVQ
jgi:spermidine/putrescine transport system substrate-binding protein